MKKVILIFVLSFILSISTVCADDDVKFSSSDGTFTVQKHVGVDSDHSYTVDFTYNFSGVTRVCAYCITATSGSKSMTYYQVGSFVADGGTGNLEKAVTTIFDGEKDSNYINTTVSSIAFHNDFSSEYIGNGSSTCAISGCPVFSSYEAAVNYLETGKYDEADLISPDGVDEYGNPIKDVVFDKNVPCPQNMRVTLQTSNTSALSTFTNFSNINIAWDNLDECDLENTFIEIQGKFDSFGYYKNGIDHIAKKKTNYNDDSADWITPCSSAFHFKTSNGKYTWYGDSKFGSQYDSQLGLQNNYYLYDYFTSRCGVDFYALDYYINKGSVRIRNCMYIDGKVHVSSWVTKLDLNGSNGSNVITDETGNPTTVTDDEGNPSDQDYEQNSDSYDSSSSNSSKESFFDWLARQMNGLSRFFASVKKSFSAATDAGTSFIAMFKSYNSWLPESFFTILVTGIGIVIFLRILGR